jgi:phosphoglycolate phosphatase-like HAD superfamily hydrolase
MPIPNPSIEFALFENQALAELAVAKFREAGFSADQLELTASSEAPGTPPREKPGGVISFVRNLLLGNRSVMQQLAAHLEDLGVPADEARYYREQVKEGRILVTVISMRRKDEAVELLSKHGSQRVFEGELGFGDVRRLE